MALLEKAVLFVPLLPAAAGLGIGAGIASGRLDGESCECLSARLARAALGASGLLASLLLGLSLASSLDVRTVLGAWLASADYRVLLSFQLDRLSLSLSALVALMAYLVARFSANYMHRERGFHRFFLVLCLFAGAMQLLVLAGNPVLTFCGWELAGVCSYLLIAYAYDRPVAAGNATRAFVTNRIGDAGFILAIALSFAWTGQLEWPKLLAGLALQAPEQRNLVAACFLLAACAKSAQVPFAPWLSRAMEGPTPSSAIFYGALMIHAGVYLVLRLEPLFAQAPAASALMAAAGLLTALYGYLSGLSQTDVKSALVFSTLAQVGLMFLACGLGFWQLATWHLFAHAIVRGYQFLTAPALMHAISGLPSRPVPAWLAGSRTLYAASLNRFWLEALGDRAAVLPVQRLADDFNAFERQVLDRVVDAPAPAVQALAALANWEEQRVGVPLGAEASQGIGGLPAWIVSNTAGALHWFEERWVLQGIGLDLWREGRRFGHSLQRLETLLAQPRYLCLVLLVSLFAIG
ncbi:MAG: proton-conducting transporter membrane subunit [Methylococcus sp.]|nr:proton-conducting transporter membrane subunit [Methylococcus sp.]